MSDSVSELPAAAVGKEPVTFAGYTLLNELGPCPGGTAYRATHPDRASELILRRLKTDWLGPDDNLAAYLFRAKLALNAEHPQLWRLWDCGVEAEELYVVLEAFAGANLHDLIRDIGPMPVPLALEFTRQAALALEAAHARGLWHGGLRPVCLWAGPLVAMSRPRADGSTRYRPASHATLKVAELGLVPRRQPPRERNPEAGVLEDAAYLPPERFERADGSRAGDVYMLGATLYFLLTAQPPFVGKSLPDLKEKKALVKFPPIEAIRPDAPAGLEDLLKSLLASDPTLRPSMTGLAATLELLLTNPQSAGRPAASQATDGSLSGDPNVVLVDIPVEQPASAASASSSSSTSGQRLASLSGVDLDAAAAEVNVVPVEEPAPVPLAFVPPPFPPSGPGEWGPPPAYAYAAPEDEAASDAAPRVSRRAAEPKMSRAKLYTWLLVGLLLQLLAVGIWVLMIYEPWKGDPEEQPAPSQTITTPSKPAKSTKTTRRTS